MYVKAYTSFSEVVPATEARHEFFTLLDKVSKANRGFTLTRGGRPIARLLNYEEWQGLLTTIEILANPRHRKQLDRRIAQVKAGKTLSLDQLID